jgi:hypothetical protein
MQESTKIAFKSNLIATLIGTAVGIWSLQLGVGAMMWPNHPQWMAFILTLIACVVVKSASVGWLKRQH